MDKASKAEIRPLIILQQYMREEDTLNMQSVLSILSDWGRERVRGRI